MLPGVNKYYIMYHYCFVMCCVCDVVTYSYLTHTVYRPVAIYECILHTDIVQV